MNIRPVRPEDAEACGRICYEAFRGVSQAHGFPPDFDAAELATNAIRSIVAQPGSAGVVAEVGGRVVGSNFLHDRWPVSAIGPITVDPQAQGRGVGRALMDTVLGWAAERGFPAVRLVQAAYNAPSLALYSSLGFDAREPLSVIQGTPPRVSVPGREVRPVAEDEVPACTEVCVGVHGHGREVDLLRAVAGGDASVVLREGRIVGYAARLGWMGHAVAETGDDLKALIAAAPSYGGLGFLLPTRNGEVLRWCLDHGLRVVQPMTLMTSGWYREPEGAFLPSIGY